MRRIALLTWLCFALWTALFFWFWRQGETLPHGAFATLSLANLALLLLWQIAYCLRIVAADFSLDKARVGNESVAKGQNARQTPAARYRRGWFEALGWLLIGAGPLTFFGAHWLDASQATRQHLARPDNPLKQIALTWLSSYFDLVSRFEHQHTRGQYVTLLSSDDSTEVKRLTDEMDQLIAQMCARLDAAPPTTVRWVRGTQALERNMAIGPWAFTNDEQDPTQVTTLDRHEVAHSVISELSGPGHTPPRFLVEGWAQTQMLDRSDLILGLARARRHGELLPLDVLLQEPFYSASRGATYSHGGPFVLYLLEQFSGHQFLALYQQCDQKTFRADVERIYEIGWPDMKSLFWSWLTKESHAILKARERDGEMGVHVELDEGVSPDAWEDLKIRYRNSAWSTRQLPKSVAFEISASATGAETYETLHARWEVVIEDDRCWLIYHEAGGLQQFVMVDKDAAADVTKSVSGAVSGMSEGREQQQEAREVAFWLLSSIRMIAGIDPADTLPLSLQVDSHLQEFRCKSLERPSEDNPLWRLTYERVVQFGSGEDGRREEHGTIWLDETNELAVAKHNFAPRSTENPNSIENEVVMLSGTPWPKSHQSELVEKSGRVVERRMWLSLLSQDAANSVKQRVQGAASLIDTRPRLQWFEYLWWMAAALPVLGAICVGLDVKLSRRQKTHLFRK